MFGSWRVGARTSFRFLCGPLPLRASCRSTVPVAFSRCSSPNIGSAVLSPRVRHRAGSGPADQNSGGGACGRAPGQHGVGECAVHVMVTTDLIAVVVVRRYRRGHYPSVSPSLFSVGMTVSFRRYHRYIFRRHRRRQFPLVPPSSFSVGMAGLRAVRAELKLTSD